MKLSGQLGLPVRPQSVAAAAYGLDDGGGGAEFASQRLDDGVDDIAATGELRSPHPAKKLIAA